MKIFKKPVVLFAFISLVASCANTKTESSDDSKKSGIATENDLKTSQANSLFIRGLKSATAYSKEQAEKGSEYSYSSGRTFKIKIYCEQVDISFDAYDESNLKQQLKTKFDVGYSSNTAAEVKLPSFKKNVKFLVGQYDFDGDGIDELIIAVQDNDLDDTNGITIDVFKLENNKWNPFGVLTATNILGEPLADVKVNRIKIDRHVRGFYYQWTLESGNFKDTSSL